MQNFADVVPKHVPVIPAVGTRWRMAGAGCTVDCRQGPRRRKDVSGRGWRAGSMGGAQTRKRPSGSAPPNCFGRCVSCWSCSN